MFDNHKDKYFLTWKYIPLVLCYVIWSNPYILSVAEMPK